MSTDIIIRKERLNHITHSVRASQAVLQYGIGAMIDFPDQTLMTAAPEFWADKVVAIHDERLEKALSVDYFGMPGGKDEIQYADGISYVRFPKWYFCPKCRKFQTLDKWLSEYKHCATAKMIERDPNMIKHMNCPKCKQDLVVARIVTVCENGHIDDFPWIKWVHTKNNFGNKGVCSNPSLTFKTGSSASEGLEGLVITCETCKAKATLSKAFDKQIFSELDEKSGRSDFICSGYHPWKNKYEKCSVYPRSIQRGSSSVYFPFTVSSLVIPPYSDKINLKIEKSNEFKDCIATLSKIPHNLRETVITSQIEQWADSIAIETGFEKSVVLIVLRRKWCGINDEQYNTADLRYKAEEYDALNGTVKNTLSSSEDFKREKMNLNDYNIYGIKSVSLIHKIREVRALTGFTRINPVSTEGDNKDNSKFVSVKEAKTNWFPAYEVRGEGIFIEFNSSIIERWDKGNPEISNRAIYISENYEKSYIGKNNPRAIDVKFILLHTISHLLIKQLSFECGYNVASLRERIYCSNIENGKIMAGILIYTASGDSEGTLGGLVRQGRPDCFSRIFKKAIESALVCSNDPICILSHGQGRESLNLGACHSCSLIPETSCEEYNVFLDRGLVVGTFDKPELGFYSPSRELEDINEIEFVDDNSSNINTGGTDIGNIKLVDGGVDQSDRPFSEIWNYIKDDTSNNFEQRYFDELIKMTENDALYEKPIYSGMVKTDSNDELLNVDLIWKNSKVMLFLQENISNYKKLKSGDWKCFIIEEGSVPIELISSIRRFK